MRHYTLFDHILNEVQHGLETVCGNYNATRENPAKNSEDAVLTQEEKKQSASFMRVNHTGEVCAQALYRGQLAVAKNSNTIAMLEQSCAEETDHLAWCDDRLKALKTHRSYLNTFFYWNSFCMGVAAGLCGDAWSLGFVEETEKQVGAHLQNHLEKLSPFDRQSRSVLEQMLIDETQHGAAARSAGGKDLPFLIQKLMWLQSKIMTSTTYWV